MSHIINEINKGAYAPYNNMTMYRKYDGEKGFVPYFKFIDDDHLSLSSNIVVNYLEYFKNDNGDIIDDLTRRKFYVVPNIPATYYQPGEPLVPTEYYTLGDVMPELVVALGGEIIPNSNPEAYYAEGELMAAGTIALGGEIKVGTGTEVKKAEWLAANGWFLSLARTPITAPYGIMDSIEATIAALPQDVPNGYVLQEPL